MIELTRDEICEKFLETIPYTLYPVQEESLLAWFSSEQGIMVCAPTGTGKTLVAEAAVYEALQTGKRMYYTTPLIALTDQKFRDMQKLVESWGFSPDDVGLVTGNHKVNPNAKILIVVAEILFNRLLHPEQFDFADVHSVVMDEFHNFNDPDRGIVWEFSIGLLPKNVRLMLLSATVGNAAQFGIWLNREHHRNLDVIQSDDRKVPLVFQWVGDMTLLEQIQWMVLGSEEERCTPALIFCFNRDECWSVADELRGKELVSAEVRARLFTELAKFNWTQGAGPKLKALLQRGVGIHHAGILPRYRRIVEYLFQQKLLAVCTCTETLSAGINLPARSVVLPSLVKGPAGKQTLIESGSAHQIFGRAGRPQFDSRGHVFVLAHEDDVKIARWQEKFDKLPADSKDPKVLAEKKALKKKQPKHNPNLQYWTESQFNKLRSAPAGNLESHGLVPWRLLAYMLNASPDVERLRTLVKKRLLFGRKLEFAQKDLDRMLAMLWSARYIHLEPEPPEDWFPKVKRPEERKDPEFHESSQTPKSAGAAVSAESIVSAEKAAPETPVEKPAQKSAFGAGIFDDEEELFQEEIQKSEDVQKSEEISESVPMKSPEPLGELTFGKSSTSQKDVKPPAKQPLPSTQPVKLAQSVKPADKPYVFIDGIAYLKSELKQANPEEAPEYVPAAAYPLPELMTLAQLKSIHPLYGAFLLQYLPHADAAERIQAFESVLELPYSLGPAVRVPYQDELPRGRLACSFLDTRLMELGLAVPEELVAQTAEERKKRREAMLEPIYTITFAEKMQRLFEYEYPLVSDLRLFPCWAAGELLKFNGNFNGYITSKGLQKQEGMVFRHVLRLILLLGEFLELPLPSGCTNSEEWRNNLQDMIRVLTETCERADPSGTRQWLENSEK